MREIGSYQIIEKLSEGATGIVYLAEKEGGRYALKHLKTSDASTLVRFRRESSTLARFNSPNLVKIFDVGEHESAPYMVMELLVGESLDRLVAANHTGVDEERCLVAASTIAAALSELHKNGLVHRDIKPANIFLTGENVFKLIDFGLIGDIKEIESETAVVGTPLYCAPEQSRLLKRGVDARSDLYSLGVTIFELLTGRTPFIGSLSDVLHQHASKMAPDAREFRPSISRAFAKVIDKLLAKDPDDRYQTAASLTFDLARLELIEKLLSENQDAQLGSKNRTNYSSKVNYVSRQVEEKKLRDAWTTINQRNPGLVVVAGLSGSGKSRLCEEFLLSRQSDDVLILRTKCQVFDKGLPLGPIRESIETILENVRSSASNERKNFEDRILAAAVGLEAPLSNFSKSLKRLFGDHSAIAAPVNHSEDSAQDNYFRSIASFFSNLCSQWDAVIFAIDDLQWMDQSSIQLLEMMFSTMAGKKFLVLGTSRNDEANKEQLNAICDKLQTFLKERIALEAFAPNQIYTLILEFLGATDIERPIIDAIRSRSQGNPFVTIDIVRACVDHGALSFRNKKWHLDATQLDKLNLSEDVFSSIIQRIESAPPAIKQYLQRAVIYGNFFDSQDIAQIACIDRKEIGPLLQSAEELGLIQCTSANRWGFVHDRIFEAILKSIPEDQLVAFTAATANFLFAKQKRDGSPSDTELLITARLCQVCVEKIALDDAVLANVHAGEIALSNFAYKEAYSFLKFAFERSSSVAQFSKASLASKLARCASFLGLWDEANELSNFAIREAATNDELNENLQQRAWIARRSGDSVLSWEYFKLAYGKQVGHYPRYWLGRTLLGLSLAFTGLIADSVFDFGRGFRREPRDKRTVALTELYYNAFSALRTLLRPVDSLIVTLRLLNLGLRKRDPYTTAIGYASLGYCFARIGMLKSLARLYASKSVELASSLGDQYLLADCKAMNEYTDIYIGSTTDYEQAIPRDLDFYSKYLEPVSRFALWEFWQQQIFFFGLTKNGLQLAAHINQELEQKGLKAAKHEIMNTYNQAWSNLYFTGKYAQAEKMKAQCLQIADELRWVPMHSGRPMRTEIGIRRFNGEMDQLFDEIVESRFNVDSKNIDQYAIYGTLLWAHVLLRKLEDKLANGTSEEILSLRHDFSSIWLNTDLRTVSPAHLGVQYHLLGRYYMLIKDFKKSLRALNKAEELANKYGLPFTLFDINHDKARISREAGNKLSTRSCLILANEIANEQGWASKIASLRSEFGELFNGIASSYDTNRSGNSSEHAGSRSSMDSRTRVEPLTHSTHISTQKTKVGAPGTLVSSGLDEVRFVDALLNVSAAFVTTIDLKEQSQLVLSEIVKLFSAQRGFVFFQSETDKHLEIIAGKDSDGTDLTILQGFSNTVVKKVVETGKPLILTGTDEGEALGSESAVLNNLRSIMATPLIIKGTAIGVVYLDSTMAKGLFTNEDIELFTTLANHLSVAFELSRMTKVELEKANLKRELDVQSAIALESRKISVLVDNMQQALFAVDTKGFVVEPVSKFSEKVFGREIVGSGVIDVLYKNVSLEEKDGVTSALNTVFGEDDLQWDLSSDKFLKKVYTQQNQEARSVLKVAPSPIWDDQQKLEKILFVVEDVTQLEALESQVRSQSAQAAAVEDILANELSSVGDFLTRATQLVEDLHARAKVMGADQLVEFLRDLHTLKGNARLFKMRKLSEQVHETESELKVLFDRGALSSDSELRSNLATELGKIDEVNKVYLGLYRRLQSSDRRTASAGSSEFAVQNLKKVYDEVRSRISDKDRNRLFQAVQGLDYVAGQALISRFAPMVSEISAQLRKEAELRLEREGLINPKHLEVLQNCFLHILRNSVDHGLEMPDVRSNLNKPVRGTIGVEFSEREGFSIIKIKDDGKGIDPNAVARKAVEKGVFSKESIERLTHSQKINLIFAPNFSTKDEATEISGRGLGLDIVKIELEKIGGSIEVESKLGNGTTFIITLPFSSEFSFQASA